MEKDKKILPWLRRRDLVYLVIVIFIFWLLTSDFGKENPLVMDNWNFAATIISIILAVLTIIYAFTQSAMTIQSTNMLEKTTRKIEQVTSELENISVNDLFKELENKIHSLESNVDANIGKHFERYTEQLTMFKSPGEIDSPFTSHDLISKEQWKEYLTRFVYEELTIVGVVLTYLYYAYRNQKTSNVIFLHEFLMKKTSVEHNDAYFEGYFMAIRTVFETLNVVKLNDSSMVETFSSTCELAFIELSEKQTSTTILMIEDFFKRN